MIPLLKTFPLVFALITQNTFLIAATSTISVSVCSLPSAPAILSPADGSTTADSSTDVSGIAESNSLVHIVRNASEVASVTASGGGSYSASSPLVVGANDIHAYVTNACGTSPNSATVTITRSAPSEEPPAEEPPSEEPPADGEGTTQDPGAESPQPAGDETPAPGEAPVQAAPALHLSAPADDITTSNPVVIVRGETSPAQRVTLFRDEQQMAAVLSDEDGFLAVSIPLQAGSNDIYAQLAHQDQIIESNHLSVTYQPPQSLSMLGNILQTFKDAAAVVAGVVADVPPLAWMLAWISVLPLMWWFIKRRLARG